MFGGIEAVRRSGEAVIVVVLVELDGELIGEDWSHEVVHVEHLQRLARVVCKQEERRGVVSFGGERPS